MLLDELTERITGMTGEEREELIKTVIAEPKRWVPNPGPQTDAYFSEADVLLYGGEPGGGKSALLLGLAFNEHKRTILMRRQYGDLERIIEDALKIHGGKNGFNGSPPPRLRISEDQTIYFRAAQRVGDEQGTMGQGRDLLAIDEATHFAESQIRFMMGWVRSEDPNQRCRTVLATNPPLSAEGLWVTKMFAPWLDPTFKNPANPGELRWVISDEKGEDLWVDGPNDHREILGKIRKPTSRSYIPASVKDNPFYAGTDYETTLDAMPEPFRSLLMGGFRVAFEDRENQVIPTQWILDAQNRWKEDGHRNSPMTTMALDPAGGGNDAEVIARRHGDWVAPLILTEGEDTADGSKTAARIVQARRNECGLVIDVGGGYAGGVSVRLKDNSIPFTKFNGANTSQSRTIDGSLGFANERAAACWALREELDPDREGGATLALPPDPELLADLTALTFEVRTNGILIISKDKIREMIGRSPGRGDAVVMCVGPGNKAARRKFLSGANLRAHTAFNAFGV